MFAHSGGGGGVKHILNKYLNKIIATIYFPT